MSHRKIIIVEDDKMLLTVISMFLKELGHEVTGAFTEAKLAIEKIRTDKPDIVLMDIHLPGSIDGITAAETIQRDFDVPIVFISSYTDDTTVNRAIKTNSYGYLVKPVDKTTLGITVDLVYSKHQSEKNIRVQEDLLDHIYDAIITLSLSGKITFANEAIRRIFGVSKESVIGKNFTDLFPNYDPLDLYERVIEKTLSEESQETEAVFINEKSDEKNLYLSFSVLKNEADEVFGLVGYLRDITLRRKAEMNADRVVSDLKAIFNGATEAIYIFDHDHKLIDLNRLAKQYQDKLFRRSCPVGSGVADVLFFLSPEELASFTGNVLDGVSHFIERVATVGKENRFFKISLYPIIADNTGDISRFCISLTDITENKRMEKDLEETRSELKPLFDSSIQRFYLCDLNLNLVAFNKAAKDIILKEFNRVLKKGDLVTDYVSSGDRMQEFLKNFELAKQGNSIAYKEPLVIRDENCWNETHLDPVMNDRGEIYRILIWTLDITERERNLIQLRDSQERYSLVARGGNDGVFDWDMVGGSVYLSPRWKSLLGYEDYELPNEFGVRDSLTHPEDIERSERILRDYLEGRTQVYENEIRLKHKKGHYVWVIERGVMQHDSEGKKIRFAGSITDVSRLKRIEAETLEANKALLEERNMFIQGNVVIARVDCRENAKITYISDNIKGLLGFSREEFVEGSVSYDDLVFEEDRGMHSAEREKAKAENVLQVAYSPYRLIRKDGSLVWVNDFATFIRNEEGTITDILGYFVDITDQKKSEMAMIDNQKKYYDLFNEANDGLIIIDQDKVFDCNTKVLEMFGYTREEILNKPMIELSPEVQPSGTSSLEKRKRKIDEAYEGKKGTTYWQYKSKDGTLFDAEVSLTVLTLSGKKYLHASIRDISDRKKIERNLRESEQKYRALLEAIPDIIFILNRAGKYVFYKPDLMHDLEVPAEQIIGKGQEDFFEGEQLEMMKKTINEVFESKMLKEVEYQLPSPKGIRHFESRISLIDQDHVMMLVRDKGQRKV